jgi:hypothetical protein
VDIFCRNVHPVHVFAGPEYPYFPVFAPEGLEPFKTCLSVMEACGGDVHADGVGPDQFRTAPFAVLEGRPYMAGRRHIFETERVPIDFRHCRFSGCFGNI